MISCLHHLALMKHDYLVSITNSAQPVGKHHHCFTLIELG